MLTLGYYTTVIFKAISVAGHRFRPMYDFGFVALDILYVYPEDSGIYMCKATNKHGSDTNQVSLQCYGQYYSMLHEAFFSIQEWTGQSMSSLLHIANDKGRWAVSAAHASVGVANDARASRVLVS